MSERIKIEPGTVQETLMMPLYGRIYCQDHFPNALPNKAAKEVASHVDYDFSKVEGPELNMLTWGLRAKMLQDAAREYLLKHPYATIINLGCGLDLSYEQIDNGTCRFINMDLPDVIAAREKIVRCHGKEMNFAADLLDLSWMETILEQPYGVDPRLGVYIICGGVLMYFHTEEMKPFFLSLAKAFPNGGICFDGENKYGLMKSNKIVERTGNGSKMHFPIGSPKKLFASWGDCFVDVRKLPIPKSVRKSHEIPSKWKFTLSLGMRLGVVKIIDVRFQGNDL